MSSFVSVGYLQPNPSRIAPGELQVTAGGHRAEGGRMADWHYLSDVSVEWPLSVDLLGIRQDCQLPSDAEIGLLLSWRSDRTNLRSSISPLPLIQGENLLQASIAGSTLGGTITLDAEIVLRRPGTAMSPLAPSRPGLLLWGASEQVVLEGAGGRFPTISADFAAEGIAGNNMGMWYLHISDADLQANCTTALAFYVNSTNPSIQEVLAGGTAARGSQIVAFMMYDVYRQLMDVATRNSEFDDRVGYERGSLGDMLVTLLRMFFPGKSISQLRRDYDLTPADVEAELLARAWRLAQ
jgi:hypothetical protein